MNIPIRFKILGHPYEVRKLHDFLETTNNLGSTNHHTGAITLQSPFPSILSETQTEQTFWHEVVHVVLYHMNHDLNEDEDFVDRFASHLHQITTTMEYIDEDAAK